VWIISKMAVIIGVRQAVDYEELIGNVNEAAPS
jgi:hypothetical protein